MVTKQATALAVSKISLGQVCLHCMKLASLALAGKGHVSIGLSCCCG